MKAKKALTHIRMTFFGALLVFSLRVPLSLIPLCMSRAKQNEWIFHEPNDGLCELLTAQFIEHHRCHYRCLPACLRLTLLPPLPLLSAPMSLFQNTNGTN